MPKISLSLNKKYSPSKSSTFYPPNSGSKTVDPTLRHRGIFWPFSPTFPSPTATIFPMFGLWDLVAMMIPL